MQVTKYKDITLYAKTPLELLVSIQKELMKLHNFSVKHPTYVWKNVAFVIVQAQYADESDSIELEYTYDRPPTEAEQRAINFEKAKKERENLAELQRLYEKYGPPPWEIETLTEDDADARKSYNQAVIRTVEQIQSERPDDIDE